MWSAEISKLGLAVEQSEREHKSGASHSEETDKVADGRAASSVYGH